MAEEDNAEEAEAEAAPVRTCQAAQSVKIPADCTAYHSDAGGWALPGH